MAETWSAKPFTRVDVLVVVVLGLLVIGAMQPLFSHVRTRAIRTGCGSNLGQIGKAMFAYANDCEGALPRAGGPTTYWRQVWYWAGPDRCEAFGLDADGSGGSASINSCFYLLVKHYQVPPKSFVCRGDKGTTEFRLSDLPGAVPKSFRLTDAWDFGHVAESFMHCSYSYHMPYGLFALTTSRDPNMAVAADRNPFIKSPAADPQSLTGFKPDLGAFWGTEYQACAGNAIAHQRKGQNVLFLNGRVAFESRAYCAVSDPFWGNSAMESIYGTPASRGGDTAKDNIYLISQHPDTGSPLGNVPCVGMQPGNERDSVLVHDPDVFPTSQPATPKR